MHNTYGDRSGRKRELALSSERVDAIQRSTGATVGTILNGQAFDIFTADQTTIFSAIWWATPDNAKGFRPRRFHIGTDTQGCEREAIAAFVSALGEVTNDSGQCRQLRTIAEALRTSSVSKLTDPSLAGHVGRFLFRYSTQPNQKAA